MVSLASIEHLEPLKLQRGTLLLPDVSALSHELHCRLQRAVERLRVGRPLEPRDWSPKRLSGLLHPLSSTWSAKNSVGETRTFTSERAILEGAWPALWKAFAEGNDVALNDALLACCLRATGGQGGFRAAEAITAADAWGGQVIFPAMSGWRESRSQLAEAATCGNSNAVFSATIAMALLLNAHPFTDGNGRTSRALFNAVIRFKVCNENLFIPLKKISNLSHGGFILRMRAAEIFGLWEDLLNYICNCVDITYQKRRREL